MHIAEKKELKQIIQPIFPYLGEVQAYINQTIKTDLRILNISGKQIFRKQGKQIRASFVLLGAAFGQMLAGRSNLNLFEAVPLAAGVELVHAATLIHDDIIDNANYRRGVKTISARWNSKVAVLVGDWMFTKGLNIAAQEKHPDILPSLINATSEMVKGELTQLEYSNFKSINRENYYKIISAKTAQFLGACLKVGALNQNCPLPYADLLDKYAYQCGLGFQIVDDSLDFSEQKSTGKDSANDYYDGKVTLPVIILMEDKANRKKELEKILTERSDAHFDRLKEMVRSEKALERSLTEARMQVQVGMDYLKELPDIEIIDIMRQLGEFFISRSY